MAGTCSLLVILILTCLQLEQTFTQRMPGRRFDISQIVRRQHPGSSGMHGVGFTGGQRSNPRLRQRFSMGQQLPSFLRRGRTGSRGIRLSEGHSGGSLRQALDHGHGHGQMSRSQMSHARGGILARNLQVIDGRSRGGGGGAAGGRGGQGRGGTGGVLPQIGGGGGRSQSERLGVISVDDIIALADAIARMRGEVVGGGQEHGAHASHPPQAPQTETPAAPPKAAGVKKDNAIPPGGQTVIVHETGGLGTMGGPPVIIADHGTSVALDPLISLGPPGITSGIHVSPGASPGGASLMEIMAPLALLQQNGQDRRNLVNHLMQDPMFLTELMKTANKKNLNINAGNLANLIRNGNVNTGNPEQNKMINSLLEQTYKNMLEEMLENIKKRLMREVESQLEVMRPGRRHHQPPPVVIHG